MRKNGLICTLIIIVLIIGFVGIVTATENVGKGKPKALEITISNVTQGTSLSGELKGSASEGEGDFRVIVDDDKHPDPAYYVNPSATLTPTETPTVAPTPTASTVIDIDEGGVGSQLCVGDSTSDVIVDFAYSDAGYANVFKLSSPSSVSLGNSQGTPPDRTAGSTPFGTTWNLGKFSAGQELIFTDSADGKTYFTGPASRNPDKVVHAAITLTNSTGTYHKYLVTFEDYWNGGDKDYNDVEFYVSGNVSTKCFTEGSSGDETDSGGSVIPVYVDVCKCGKIGSDKQTTCIALFSYKNTAGVQYTIPIRGKSLPWNEFTGSGMVGQDRCQPEIFYVTESTNSPFWTNRFWNNIQWKLGYDHSILVKCEKNTRACNTTEKGYCTSCTDTS